MGVTLSPVEVRRAKAYSAYCLNRNLQNFLALVGVVTNKCACGLLGSFDTKWFCW